MDALRKGEDEPLEFGWGSSITISAEVGFGLVKFLFPPVRGRKMILK